MNEPDPGVRRGLSKVSRSRVPKQGGLALIFQLLILIPMYVTGRSGIYISTSSRSTRSDTVRDSTERLSTSRFVYVGVN